MVQARVQPGFGKHDHSRPRGDRPLDPQEQPLAAKDLDEIVGHRAHARNLPQIAADQEPHVALGQTFAQQDLDEAWIIGRHVARQKRHAVARAGARRLRCLAAGTERESPLAELALVTHARTFGRISGNSTLTSSLVIPGRTCGS